MSEPVDYKQIAREMVVSGITETNGWYTQVDTNALAKELERFHKAMAKARGEKEFNINHYVWVKLTDRGRKLINTYYDELNFRYPHGVKFTLTEVNGWSRWQMWDLMEKFGKYCGLGVEIPFETTIRFDDPNAEGT